MDDGKDTKTILRLYFAADNDFFKNQMLQLTVHYDDGGEDQKVMKTEATEIEWLEGKDTTKKKIKKKQKHKKTGETRTVMKTVEAESFFNLFQSLTRPDDVDEDDEDGQALEDKLDLAGQYLETIEEELISDATSRYLGFYDDYGDYGDEMGPDDGDDDSDNSDGDDKPKKGKG